ncbi:MAG: serine hydrolase domain-containing protein [Saprospiraceae bacterium]
MKNLRLITLLTLLLSSTVLVAQDSNSTTTTENLMTELVKGKKVAGITAGYSILGGPQWSDSKGHRDCKTKQRFEATTITRIASIAKPMTAIAILQLREQGKIDIDQPIQHYLPQFPKKAKGEITTRHLIQHAAGIGAYESNKERQNKIEYTDLESAISIFKDRELLSTPGQNHSYSSYGYILLGRIVEIVSGMKYQDYIQKNIWDVAGMANTSVEVYGKIYNNKSKLYHKKRKAKRAKQTNLSDRIPAGGIQSTLEDLLKFGDALLSGKLISEESWELMITNSEVKKDRNYFGLGLYLYGENPLIGNLYGHSGSQTGCSAMLFLAPEKKATIVAVTNTSRANNEIGKVTMSLFEAVDSASSSQ